MKRIIAEPAFGAIPLLPLAVDGHGTRVRSKVGVRPWHRLDVRRRDDGVAGPELDCLLSGT